MSEEGTKVSTRSDKNDHLTITTELEPLEREPLNNNSNAFDEFWSVYPRKLGKGEAKRAFEKAVSKHGADVVMNGVMSLAADPNLPEPQFIPRAATWLNGERWGDDPYPPKPGVKADRFVKPAADIPGARAWVRALHDQGEHWECRDGEFGCK
jgi:hypothetical protein